jgi:hypothetical protein
MKGIMGRRQSMMRLRGTHVLFWLLCWRGMAALHCGGAPVAACGIDGIPSLTMNGRLVTINHGQATRDNLSYYAPFLLGGAGLGARLRFAEDASKLHKTLTDKAFATPFQWTFGDGGTAHGLAASHRYSTPGWYKIDVSYYYTPQRRWVVFDSAQLLVQGAAAGRQAAVPIAGMAGGAALGLGAIAVAAWSLRRQAAASADARRGRGRAGAGSRRPARRERRNGGR